MVVGGLGTVLCALLFFCTGMIYACLQFLQEWHTPLTVINYMLFGSASGLLLATAYAAIVEPHLVAFSRSGPRASRWPRWSAAARA